MRTEIEQVAKLKLWLTNEEYKFLLANAKEVEDRYSGKQTVLIYHRDSYIRVKIVMELAFHDIREILNDFGVRIVIQAKTLQGKLILNAWDGGYEYFGNDEIVVNVDDKNTVNTD